MRLDGFPCLVLGSNIGTEEDEADEWEETYLSSCAGPPSAGGGT